jgi:4-aminobutyrate aminotransferase-like enzyme
VIEEEGLSENAAKMGEIFSRELSNLRPDIVLKMRGVGLFWAMVIDRKDGKTLKRRRDKIVTF